MHTKQTPMTKKQWAARKGFGGTLGQLLRRLERQVWPKIGRFGTINPKAPRTYDAGRNAAKRAMRAGLPRKHWPVLPK